MTSPCCCCVCQKAEVIRKQQADSRLEAVAEQQQQKKEQAPTWSRDAGTKREDMIEVILDVHGCAMASRLCLLVG